MMTPSRKQARPAPRKAPPPPPAEGEVADLVAGKGKDKGRGKTEWEGKAKEEATATWRLYVLRCADRSLYCGITNDVERRLARHNAGTGARYTRGRGPLVLERSWPAASKAEALKMEHWFKKLRKSRKEQVVKAETQDFYTEDARPENAGQQG